MTAFYNEIDPFAAEWLRELIKAGAIAPGIVDERSIEDIAPDELDGFTQCHFFAGIGVWSYALRQSGWPDDRPVWTGSCPCQPFSAAGKGAGFADERHLWPAFFHLLEQCRPAIVFGEQVASKAVEPWIDLVQTDLEAVGYAFGCVPFPSASVGAPHIRDRAYWVADSAPQQHDRTRSRGAGRRNEHSDSGATRGMADSNKHRCCQGGGGISKDRNDGPVGDCTVSRMANPSCAGLERSDQGEMGRQRQAIERGGGVVGLAYSGRWKQQECGLANTVFDGRHGAERPAGATGRRGSETTNGAVGTPRMPSSQTNGFWRDVDWLFCRDGKWRPTQSEIFPLAPRTPQHVGLLRGAGNAINAEAAKAFITAFMEVK